MNGRPKIQEDEKMTNKEYKTARKIAENAGEVYTFEHYGGGFYPSRYMTAEDLRDLRKEYKRATEQEKAAQIDTRAAVIPADGGQILRSYYTDVAAIIDGRFYRLWDGFSVTTLKHVNMFRACHGQARLSKREWIETPIGMDVIDAETTATA